MSAKVAPAGATTQPKVSFAQNIKDKVSSINLKEIGERGTYMAVGERSGNIRWWRMFTIIFLIISVIILTVGASRYSEYNKIPKNDTTTECTKHFSPKDDITMMTVGSIGTVVFGYITYKMGLHLY
jgi:hypothetical protein